MFFVFLITQVLFGSNYENLNREVLEPLRESLLVSFDDVQDFLYVPSLGVASSVLLKHKDEKTTGLEKESLTKCEALYQEAPFELNPDYDFDQKTFAFVCESVFGQRICEQIAEEDFCKKESLPLLWSLSQKKIRESLCFKPWENMRPHVESLLEEVAAVKKIEELKKKSAWSVLQDILKSVEKIQKKNMSLQKNGRTVKDIFFSGVCAYFLQTIDSGEIFEHSFRCRPERGRTLNVACCWMHQSVKDMEASWCEVMLKSGTTEKLDPSPKIFWKGLVSACLKVKGFSEEKVRILVYEGPDGVFPIFPALLGLRQNYIMLGWPEKYRGCSLMSAHERNFLGFDRTQHHDLAHAVAIIESDFGSKRKCLMSDYIVGSAPPDCLFPESVIKAMQHWDDKQCRFFLLLYFIVGFHLGHEFAVDPGFEKIFNAFAKKAMSGQSEHVLAVQLKVILSALRDFFGNVDRYVDALESTT